MQKSLELQSVIWQEGKYYVAQCLNIDVSSFGKSRQEALCNLSEAVALYLEDSNDLSRVTKPEVIKHTLAHA